MFGDILSNLAASLVGGLGLAPGLNFGSRHAMAQAGHGSAPDIEHLDIANPVAEILSGSLLLEWMAVEEAMPSLTQVAKDVQHAVAAVLAAGDDLTPDLGGQGTTDSLTSRILGRL
jgi:3-isopropylmalate dehydrogenase